MQKRIFKKSFGHALQECGILVPRPGIELESPTAEVHSVTNWTSREVSQKRVLNTEEGKFIPHRYLVPPRFREPGKLFLTKKKRVQKKCHLTRCGGGGVIRGGSGGDGDEGGGKCW